jgi:hypothetical protein
MNVLELRNVIIGILEHNGAKIVDAGMELETPEAEIGVRLGDMVYDITIKERGHVNPN